MTNSVIKAVEEEHIRGKFIRQLMISAAIGIYTIAPSGVISQATAQVTVNPTYDLDIASQPLANALSELAQKTGLQIGYQSDLIEDLTSSPIEGNLDIESALSLMLQGTNIQFEPLSDGTTTLYTKNLSNAETSTVTEPLVVNASRETAVSSVDGYRATRSATGTRTDTALRDIPQSIQVVPRDVISDQSAIELKDVIQNVSSVQQNSTSGNRASTFKVRGFASSGYSIDGVMLNATGDRPETFLDLSDVERVEVLKGPASALYGRAEPGGVINVVTRRPTTEFEADTTLSTGSNEFWRGEGSVSGPLNESKTLSGRFSTGLQSDEGFRNAGISRRQSVSGALSWQPNNNTTLNTHLNYTHQDVPFDRGLIVTADNEVSLPSDRFLAERWSRVDSDKFHSSMDLEHQVNDVLKLRGTLVYDQALTQDTGIDLRTLQADGRTLTRRYTDREEDLNSFTSRFDSILDFDTGDVSHTMLGGLEYSLAQMKFKSYRANISSIDIYNPVYGASQVSPTLNNDFVDDIKTVSAILQDQIEFSPKWKALIGLRYDTVDQEQDNKMGDDDAPMSDSALTKRFGLVYQPVEPLSLYTSYGESFSPQSGQTSDGSTLDPEEGWQAEIGAKFDLVPDRLSLTASAFHIIKQNVATTDPDDSNYSVLTGEQRVRGVELDLSGEVLPGWNIITSAAYLDAVVTKDEDYDVGNRLGGVPEWSGSLWSKYTFSQGELDGLSIGGGVQMVGARKGDLDNSYSVDGYATFDASVSYQLTDHVELSLTGKNLTDADYIETPVSRTENYAGAPLSVYAALKVKM